MVVMVTPAVAFAAGKGRGQLVPTAMGFSAIPASISLRTLGATGAANGGVGGTSGGYTGTTGGVAGAPVGLQEGALR
jgi:hypothetical protein